MSSNQKNEFSGDADEFHNRVVWHDSYLEAREAVELARRMHGTESAGVMLLGDPGLGKSFFIRNDAKKHNTQYEGEVDKHPYLYLDTPPDLSVDGYLSDMLEKLGDPEPDQGRLPRKRRRLKHYIKELGVQIIFIDEFQDILAQRNITARSKGVKFVKWLMNEARVSVVLAGLPLSEEILKVDEQLNTRFNTVIHLKPFSMINVEEYEHYMGFMEALLSMFPRTLVGGLNHEMLVRLLLASNGIPRTLKKLLVVAIDATEKGAEVDKVILHDAWMKVIPRAEHQVGNAIPFCSTLRSVEKTLQDKGMLAHGF